MKFYFKNFKFLLFFIFVIFLSCPTDMVKYTTWKGTYTTNSGEIRKLELIFDSTSRVSGIFESDDNPDNYLILQSDYTITENYTFKAGYFEADLSMGGGAGIDHLKIELNGTLNYFSNIGEGIYTFIKDYDNDTGEIIKKGWKVYKLSD